MYIGVALSFCSNDTSAADEQSLLLVPLALVELKSWFEDDWESEPQKSIEAFVVCSHPVKIDTAHFRHVLHMYIFVLCFFFFAHYYAPMLHNTL